jgi:hypothetical protein
METDEHVRRGSVGEWRCVCVCGGGGGGVKMED